MSVMKDDMGGTMGTMGARDSHRQSRASHLSQRSIISNPPEKPVSLAGSKAFKG